MFLSSNEKGMDVPAEYEPFIQIKCGVCFHRFSCYFRAHSCFEISIRVLKRINKTSFCEYIVKVNVWIGACYYHLGAIESALDRYSETVLDELQTSQEVEKHSNSKLLFQLMTDCFRKMKYFAAAEACSEHPKKDCIRNNAMASMKLTSCLSSHDFHPQSNCIQITATNVPSFERAILLFTGTSCHPAT